MRRHDCYSYWFRNPGANARDFTRNRNLYQLTDCDFELCQSGSYIVLYLNREYPCHWNRIYQIVHRTFCGKPDNSGESDGSFNRTNQFGSGFCFADHQQSKSGSQSGDCSRNRQLFRTTDHQSNLCNSRCFHFVYNKRKRSGNNGELVHQTVYGNVYSKCFYHSQSIGSESWFDNIRCFGGIHYHYISNSDGCHSGDYAWYRNVPWAAIG